jgi:hypothetical protein
MQSRVCLFAPCTAASSPYGHASGVLASQVTTCHASSTRFMPCISQFTACQVRPGVVKRLHHLSCIRFHCSNHVVQLTLLRCFPVFSSGFACVRWEKRGFAFRPRGVEQLLYPCRVSGPRPLKLCARSHSGITGGSTSTCPSIVQKGTGSEGLSQRPLAPWTCVCQVGCIGRACPIWVSR